MRGGTLFSSTTTPMPLVPFSFPFPRTLEVGVAAVPGEEERDPGEAAVASGSRKDAVEDSRRREGILDWDLAPGVFCPEFSACERMMEVQSLLTVPTRARGVPNGDISNSKAGRSSSNQRTRHFLFLDFRR